LKKNQRVIIEYVFSVYKKVPLIFTAHTDNAFDVYLFYPLSLNYHESYSKYIACKLPVELYEKLLEDKYTWRSVFLESKEIYIVEILDSDFSILNLNITNFETIPEDYLPVEGYGPLIGERISDRLNLN
jgi:hypothetical protein